VPRKPLLEPGRSVGEKMKVILLEMEVNGGGEKMKLLRLLHGRLNPFEAGIE